MSASFPQLRLGAAEGVGDDVGAWRTALRARVQAGARPVTLFGRTDGDRVRVTAVVEERGALEAFRVALDPAHGYHALTRELPAFHPFERELHEQHGVRVADHPWLKPIRFEGAGPGAMDRYPFYKIDGKEVHEVQVGPIHAGVIEPGAFRFMCLGEVVHHLEIHLGFQHRGVESLLLQRPPTALGPLVETIAGDTSIGHAWAWAQAVEALAGVEVPPELELARGVGLELERVAMHLAGLAGLCTDIGFQQGASTYGRLRTTAINTSMRLCGSRFGRGWIRAGASRAAMDATVAQVVRDNLALLVRDLAPVNELFLAARTVQHRFRGVGRVTREQALDVGLVGPAARASGVDVDTRTRGLGLYGGLPVTAVVEESGDCWARAVVRIRELDRSLAWLGAAVERATTVAPAAVPLGPLAPDTLVIATCEGWRGEVVHAIETDGEGRVVHYKVQDPSLRNWFGLALAVRDNEISDFPICNKSFDLSYCGNDL